MTFEERCIIYDECLDVVWDMEIAYKTAKKFEDALNKDENQVFLNGIFAKGKEKYYKEYNETIRDKQHILNIIQRIGGEYEFNELLKDEKLNWQDTFSDRANSLFWNFVEYELEMKHDREYQNELIELRENLAGI